MKLKNLIIVTFLTLTACQTLWAIDNLTDENPYFLLMGEAQKAIEEENYEEAAARLIDALNVDPVNPSNLLVKSNLGMVYSCLGRDSLAIATLNEVIDTAPNMTAALVNRGKVELKIQRDDEAFSDFSRVIAIDSLNADARYFHGMIALYGGRLAIAEDDFTTLEKLQPDRLRTFDAMSALYSLSGRDHEAVPYFEKLIDRQPEPEYFASLAGCYLALGELSDASATIADGLKRYPTDPELYYYRAWLNRDRFRLDDARKDAQQALRYGASEQKVKDLFAP